MKYLVKQHSRKQGLFGKEETVNAGSVKSATKKYRDANDTEDQKIAVKRVDADNPVWLYCHPKHNFRVTEF